MSNTLRTIIILVVSVVWASNFLAPIFVPEYTPAPELNVAFMAIIGVLSASYERDAERKQREQDRKDKEAEAKRKARELDKKGADNDGEED